MRSSIPFYDSMAQEFDTTFYDVPHRKAYDQLAWEHVSTLLSGDDLLVVDAGCGAGRWVDRLLLLGHHVIGIEQAPAMIRLLRSKNYGPRFHLIAGSMEDADVEPGSVDAVLAMGSLQYTPDPASTVRRFGQWVRPGGFVAVLLDSYLALVLELLDRHATQEAVRRLDTHRAVWRRGEQEAEYHLLDRRSLETYFTQAGLHRVTAHGLLVTFSAWGRARLQKALLEDEQAVLALERSLSRYPELADAGKQMLVTGFRPA